MLTKSSKEVQVFNLGKLSFTVGDVIAIGAPIFFAGVIYAGLVSNLAMANQEIKNIKEQHKEDIQQIQTHVRDAISDINQQLGVINEKQIAEQIKTSVIKNTVENMSRNIDRIADKLDAR